MMNKFGEWFVRNRKPIGYTIGGLNVLSGLNYVLEGNTGMGVLWIVIGSFLIWDAYEYK